MSVTVSLLFLMWVRSFVFTLAAEVPVYVLLVWKKVPLWRAVVAGMAGTCLTHPLLWFVWPKVVSDYTVYIVTGEILVAVIETLVFWIIARPVFFSRAVAASFIANAVSYGLGMLLRALGVPL